MFVLKEYVPANEIWEHATSFVDKGQMSGLMRGYNIEVTSKDNCTYWLSCCYTYEDPVDYFNDEFNSRFRKEHNLTPTGRICFRGYGREEYDTDERESYIIPVDINNKGEYTYEH